MNIKDKIAYARLKLPGVKNALLFNNGDYGVSYLIQREILAEMAKPQYLSRSGQIQITLSFDGPITDDTTQEEREIIEAENRLRALCIPMEEIRASQDPDKNLLTDIMMGETDMSPEDLILFKEYRKMFSEKYRMTKSGDYIRQIKTEAESKFAHIKGAICCNLGNEDWWQV